MPKLNVELTIEELEIIRGIAKTEDMPVVKTTRRLVRLGIKYYVPPEDWDRNSPKPTLRNGPNSIKEAQDAHLSPFPPPPRQRTNAEIMAESDREIKEYYAKHRRDGTDPYAVPPQEAA